MEKSGTTIVGIKGKDFVVLAADKQSTEGFIKYNLKEKKIYPIENYMGIATSGLVGDAQALVRFLESRVRFMEIELGEKPTPRAVTSYLALILNSAKIIPYFVGLIVGGYKDEPYLASLDAAGGLDEQDYVAHGSGMIFALPILDDGYKKNIKEKEAVKLAIRAVEAAKKRDVFSGGYEPGVDVLIIDAQGAHFVDEKEVIKLKR